MPTSTSHALYKAFTKVIIYLWFLFKITGVIMLLLFAVVIAIIINAPITWLEKKKIKRHWACAIVLGSILVTVGLLCWLIIPIISNQLTILINNIPSYI